jgi:hypothetical protein
MSAHGAEPNHTLNCPNSEAGSPGPGDKAPGYCHLDEDSRSKPGRLAYDRVGSRRLRTVTLPHHRTCGFPHPAVEPGSEFNPLRPAMVKPLALLPWSLHSAPLHCISPGAGSLPIARFLQAVPLLYSPRADRSRKCARGSLLDCFGKLLAPLCQSSSSWSVSWFFGPSLLPAFTGFLHYYGLC